MPLDLYHVVFRIAQFRDESMNPLVRGRLGRKAKTLLAELCRWESSINDTAANSGRGPCRYGDIYNQIALLYILAASVLLRGVIASPGIDDITNIVRDEWQTSIESRVSEASRLVSSMDKTDPSANCFLGTWALQVLSNACRPSDQARSVFENELLRRHLVMKSGDIRRALSLLGTEI